MVKFKDYSRPLSIFSTFQCKLNFQGLFKTFLYIQVCANPVSGSNMVFHAFNIRQVSRKMLKTKGKARVSSLRDQVNVNALRNKLQDLIIIIA